ncbi:MAG TPA: TlpA disulfide reductase family protein [Bryobacteraceae bacterium]|nr:TlpA disulfide reductase family protein [Bryobacteraceae bacterium]
MAHGTRHKLLQKGARVNEFTLPRLGGGETSLSEITAKGPALLAFFKVNCPVCQMTFPFLERIQSAAGLPVYGISQNCAEDTRDFNRHFGLTLPMLLDAESSGFAVSNTFGISSVPTLFLVEPDGTIAQVSEGWHKGDIAQFAARAGVDSLFKPSDSVPEAKAG